jgi:phosphorylcholine metabolism protein LicD
MSLNHFFESKFWLAIRYFYSSKKRRDVREKKKQIIFQEYALEALENLYIGINEYNSNVNLWLEFGTLLGAYRDKKFISYDYDLDFGIDHDSLTEELIEHLKNFGFTPISKFVITSDDLSINDYNAEYTINFKGKVNIDLFAFKQIKDSVIFFFFDKEDGLSWKETERKYNQHLRAKTKLLSTFSLNDSLFLGKNVRVPTNTKQHLSEIYGDNFMIPMQYSYNDRPKNLEILLDNKTLGKRIVFTD